MLQESKDALWARFYGQESLKTLAKRCGINPKTVAKWRKRGSVAELPTGPKQPKSTGLSIEDEAIIQLKLGKFRAG